MFLFPSSRDIKFKSVGQLKLKLSTDELIVGKKLALEIHISLLTSYILLEYGNNFRCSFSAKTYGWLILRHLLKNFF